jgi:AraC-like DNA-binding protein
MNQMQPVKKEIQIDGFFTVYYFEHGKDFYHAPEQHDYWEMVYVDRGRIVTVTDGIGSVLEEGWAIFHEPNDVHAHVSNHRDANNMFVVTFRCDSPAMEFFRKKTFQFNKESKKLLHLFMQEAANAVGEIQHDYATRQPLDFSGQVVGSSQLMAAYLEELLIKLIRSGEQAKAICSNAESRRIGQDSTLDMIEEYLQASLYQPLTLTQLCEHFYISKSHLSSLCSEGWGQSPMQVYAALKIAEAKKLLREDRMTVGEIADALCYSGIHSFSRTFKNATGFSPSAYRQSIGK